MTSDASLHIMLVSENLSSEDLQNEENNANATSKSMASDKRTLTNGDALTEAVPTGEPVEQFQSRYKRRASEAEEVASRQPSVSEAHRIYIKDYMLAKQANAFCLALSFR